MIVLDTDVVSELMHPSPDPAVLAWADDQLATDLYLTSMTVAELLYGVARLPAGRRRDDLGDRVGRLLDEYFAGRILPFDAAAAVEYARIATLREYSGMPIGTTDAAIAATATAAGADGLATRNLRDFEGTGLVLIDPWNRL